MVNITALLSYLEQFGNHTESEVGIMNGCISNIHCWLSGGR